jgi:hypothetical protein
MKWSLSFASLPRDLVLSFQREQEWGNESQFLPPPSISTRYVPVVNLSQIVRAILSKGDSY